MNKVKILTYLLFVFLVSCASVVSTKRVDIPKNASYVVLPFENNTVDKHRFKDRLGS